MTGKGYKARGIDEKVHAVKQYCKYVECNGIDIFQLTTSDAESYREYLRLLTKPDGTTYYNPKTINGRIVYLRLFYRYLLIMNKVYRNPFGDVESLKVCQSVPKNILSIKQMEKLLNSIIVNTNHDFKFKVIVELLYASGMRINEVSALTIDTINIETGFVLVKDDKTRKDRYVPLTEYCCSLLQLYVEYYDSKDTYLFRHGQMRTLNSWMNKRLKTVSKNIHVPLITCHGFRHSIATHLLQNGADLREVQEILGHRRIQSTEVYTRIFPDDLKKTIEKTHPREKE